MKRRGKIFSRFMMVGCVLCVLIAIAVAIMEVKLWTDTFCDFTIMIAFGYVIWGGMAAALVMTLVAMFGGITVLLIPKEKESNKFQEDTVASAPDPQK